MHPAHLAPSSPGSNSPRSDLQLQLDAEALLTRCRASSSARGRRAPWRRPGSRPVGVDVEISAPPMRCPLRPHRLDQPAGVVARRVLEDRAEVGLGRAAGCARRYARSASMAALRSPRRRRGRSRQAHPGHHRAGGNRVAGRRSRSRRPRPSRRRRRWPARRPRPRPCTRRSWCRRSWPRAPPSVPGMPAEELDADQLVLLGSADQAAVARRPESRSGSPVARLLARVGRQPSTTPRTPPSPTSGVGAAAEHRDRHAQLAATGASSADQASPGRRGAPAASAGPPTRTVVRGGQRLVDAAPRRGPRGRRRSARQSRSEVAAPWLTSAPSSASSSGPTR